MVSGGLTVTFQWMLHRLQIPAVLRPRSQKEALPQEPAPTGWTAEATAARREEVAVARAKDTRRTRELALGLQRCRQGGALPRLLRRRGARAGGGGEEAAQDALARQVRLRGELTVDRACGCNFSLGEP